MTTDSMIGNSGSRAGTPGNQPDPAARGQGDTPATASGGGRMGRHYHPKAAGGFLRGHGRDRLGTAGCVVLVDGQDFILTCSHVMRDVRPIDSPPAPFQQIPAYQPGADRRGRSLDSLRVGYLARAEELRVLNAQADRRAIKDLNPLDAALIRRTTGASHEIIDVGYVAGPPAAPVEGMAVKKSGGATGVTHGWIRAIKQERTLGFGWDPTTREPKYVATFKDQLLVRRNGWGSRRFASEGDSGALILTEADNAPVGILIGVTAEGLGVVTPIREVLSAFQAEIVHRRRPNR